MFQSSGYERLQADIKLMLGKRIGLHWKILWKYVSPVTLVVSITLKVPWKMALFIVIWSQNQGFISLTCHKGSIDKFICDVMRKSNASSKTFHL